MSVTPTGGSQDDCQPGLYSKTVSRRGKVTGPHYFNPDKDSIVCNIQVRKVPRGCGLLQGLKVRFFRKNFLKAKNRNPCQTIPKLSRPKVGLPLEV